MSSTTASGSAAASTGSAAARAGASSPAWPSPQAVGYAEPLLA
ncbi:hypothetical protein [Nonomuraea sp. NPDC050202]